MKKLTSLGVLAFAGVVAVLALLGSQTAAQAYPELKFDLKASRTVLYEGQTFTATAVGNVNCDWTLAWNGASRTAQRHPNNTFSTTFTAPAVTKVTKIPLHGTCGYSTTEHPVDPTFRGAAAATWKRTIVIRVLPRSAAVSPPSGGSNLPSTGGPNLIFLAGGLLLVLSGAAAVIVARRRAEEAEIRAFQA